MNSFAGFQALQGNEKKKSKGGLGMEGCGKVPSAKYNIMDGVEPDRELVSRLWLVARKGLGAGGFVDRI
jgi:hypothetical protein